MLLFLLLFGTTVRAQQAFFGRPASSTPQGLLQYGDATPLTNAHQENWSSPATLVSNGRDALVVWTYNGIVRVNAVHDGRVEIAQHAVTAFDSAHAAWTGSSYVVAAANKLRFFDARGLPSGPELVPLLPEYRTPRVASNGKNILLLAHANEIVHAFRLTLAGTLIDVAGTLIDRIPSGRSAIATNGSGYAVITSSNEAIRITRLDDNGAVLSQHPITAMPRAGVPAIASDGRDYLAVWNDQNGTISAVAIGGDGTLGATFTVALPQPQETLSTGSVVWNGSSYSIAFTAQTSTATPVLYLTTATPTGAHSGLLFPINTTETMPSLALVGGRVTVASSTKVTGVLVTSMTGPGLQRTTLAGARTSRSQINVATATSVNGTLFVWHEWSRLNTFETRVGVRGRDGSWTEHEAAYRRSAFAASDGTGFLVGGDDGGDSWVSLLGEDGSFQATIEIPFEVTDAAWNGRDYIVVGLDQNKVVAARVSAAGTLAPTVLIRDFDGVQRRDPRVASDGTNALVVWIRAESFICFPPCTGQSDTVAGALLAPNLTELIPGGIVLDEGPDCDNARVTWDGSQYAAVYTNDGIFARHVSAQGGVSSRSFVASGTLVPATPMPLSITRAGNAAAIAFSQSSKNELRSFESDGTVRAIGTFPIEQKTSFQFLRPLIASLPDGRTAYVAPRWIEGTPHYGVDRLHIAIAGVAPPPEPPDPPVLSMTFNGNDLEVTWPQVEGANGYRLEDRVADGSWTELDQWFDDENRRVTVRLGSLLSTTPYAIRVRAWGDGGVSAYSAPILLGGKRRAVR